MGHPWPGGDDARRHPTGQGCAVLRICGCRLFVSSGRLLCALVRANGGWRESLQVFGRDLLCGLRHSFSALLADHKHAHESYRRCGRELRALGGFCFLGVLLPICWALDKFYDGPLRAFLLTRGQSKYATVPKKA